MPAPLTVPPEPWTFVQEASDRLLEQVVEAGGLDSETLAEARHLLARLAASGRLTREPDHRRILRNKLSYWASEIRFETSELVHPPRLLPAGRGSGLAIEQPAAFEKRLKGGATPTLDDREVQGVRFDGGGKVLTGVSVVNSFLLRCSLRHVRISGDFSLAKTSVVGGDLTSIETLRFDASDARFLGPTIKDLDAGPTPSFKYVRMPHTIVDGGKLVDANFEFANLAGGGLDAKDAADIEEYGVAVGGTGATRFERVDLRRASFGGDAGLKGTTFDNCNLEGASFGGSSIAGAVFVDCDFRGDEFKGARDAELATVTDSRETPAPDPRAHPLAPDDQRLR